MSSVRMYELSWKRAGAWLNGAASKADGPRKGHVGSNPTASATRIK